MKEDIIQTFRNSYQRDPEVVVRAPGRINLLGEHLDYNEGWALPAAIDRAIWLAAAPSQNGTVTIQALDLQQEGTFHLTHLHPNSKTENPDLAWLNFPAGVAWAMQQAGHSLIGMEAVFAGDVPIGSGVSSSAAVEVAFILAWEALSGLKLEPLAKARLGQKAENGYLGVQSGIMDQFASIHGKAGHVIRLDCRSLHHDLITIPAGMTVLVADSGVARELTGSEYNLRRRQCEEAVTLLKAHLPHVQALRDVSAEEFELYAHCLPALLRRRARHVVEECARVLAGVEALRQNDLSAFGQYIRQSHISLRDLYEVSIPELDVLAAAAWQIPGCYGARLMGAGFGGSALILAATTAVDDVIEAIGEMFEETFGRKPVIFSCEIAAGAEIVAG